MSTMPCSQKNCKQINGADYKSGFSGWEQKITKRLLKTELKDLNVPTNFSLATKTTEFPLPIKTLILKLF